MLHPPPLFAQVLCESVDLDQVNTAIGVFNGLALDQRANRGALIMAACHMLGDSIANAAPDNQGETRAGIHALIDAVALQVSTRQGEKAN